LLEPIRNSESSVKVIICRMAYIEEDIEATLLRHDTDVSNLDTLISIGLRPSGARLWNPERIATIRFYPR
jgi:hypothetical protein